MKKTKNTKQTKKKNKLFNETPDPSLDLAIGTLLFSTNSINSNILFERYAAIIGIIIAMEGAWRLHLQAKKKEKKTYIYILTYIIYLIIFIATILNSLNQPV